MNMRQQVKTVRLEMIGPHEAAKMLERVHPRQSGRNIVAAIQFYAAQMKSGEWDSNVLQTISISDRGELVDGWHRLHAVIKSGATVCFLVARGVPGDTFAKYDAGRSRQLSFRLGMNKSDAAICQNVLYVCKYGRKMVGTSVEEMLTVHEFIRDDLEAFYAIAGRMVKRRLTNAPVVTGCVLQIKRCPEHADRIASNFRGMVAGELSDIDPVVVQLYRRLVERNESRPVTVAASYLAFDPARANNTKLLVRDVSTTFAEIRADVLQELCEAIA